MNEGARLGRIGNGLVGEEAGGRIAAAAGYFRDGHIHAVSTGAGHEPRQRARRVILPRKHSIPPLALVPYAGQVPCNASISAISRGIATDRSS